MDWVGTVDWPTVGTWLIIALAAVLIGLGKAGFGGGLGPLITPLLTWGTGSAAFAIGVSLPLLIVGDLYVARKFWGQWDKRVAITMLPGGLMGIAVGSWLLSLLADHEMLFNRVIGIVALAFVGLQLVLEVGRMKRERAAQAAGVVLPDAEPAPAAVGVLAGLATAIVSTIAHQGGLVSNLYLLSQRLTKERFVAMATALYFTLNVVKLGPYLYQGIIDPAVLRSAAWMVPLVLIGGMMGAAVLHRIDREKFTLIVLGLTLIAGLKLALDP